MSKRKDRIARVDRQVLPKEELYITDLWGNRSVKLVWCRYHKRYEDCRDFYKESESKSKSQYQLRTMCIEAWDLTNGNISYDVEPSSACLIDFIKG